MLTSSLVIGVASMAFSWIAKLIAMKMQGNKELREAELKALNAKAQVTKDAREYNNQGFQFTRRFLAVLLGISVVALPLMAPLWYQYTYPIDVINSGMEPSIWFGYNVVDKGFWPFTSDATITQWKEFKGLVITPWHTDMFAWVMGMYFGNRMGNGRM
jgi:CDP-diglyceride synthetase